MAALGAWSLAMPGAGSARADDAQVTVVAPGGAEQALALAALAGGEDVTDRAYSLRGPEGESTQTVTGFSPAALLEAAGVDLYAFSYLEVQRPAGGSVPLSREQALAPGAFADGPPVIYATAGGTGFLRPSAAPDDENAADSFAAPQGISIVLRRGSPLRVRAQASTVRTRPGRPVTFTAVVDRAGAGERLSYSWYFDDGHSASGAGVRHRFAKRGSYDVVVGVTAPGDDVGASAVVTVQVGAPIAGPNRKGGGSAEEADAPDHGAATGGGAGAGNGTGGSAGSSSGGWSRFEPLSEPNLDHGPKENPPRRAAKPPADGELISGVLLAGAETSPPKPPTPNAAARTGKLEGQGSGAGLPGAALGLLVTAGLLGLGALAELRSPGEIRR